MRIQSQTYVLSLDIKKHNENRIDIYDSNLNLLSATQKEDSNRQNIQVQIHLPSKLIFKISSVDDLTKTQPLVELVKMNLVGINVDKENILKVIDYRPTEIKYHPTTLDIIDNLSAYKTLEWGEGYVTINFFHPDPFSFLLYIGNKIKFK